MLPVCIKRFAECSCTSLSMAISIKAIRVAHLAKTLSRLVLSAQIKDNPKFLLSTKANFTLVDSHHSSIRTT